MSKPDLSINEPEAIVNAFFKELAIIKLQNEELTKRVRKLQDDTAEILDKLDGFFKKLP